MFKDKRTRLMGIAAIAVVVVWIGAVLPGPSTLSVTFFDMGDGECTLIRTPSGRTMVIDCGTSSWRDASSVGSKLIVPYLQSLGVDSIDVAVLTHPHSDHLSGFAGLLKTEPARLVIDSGLRQESPEYYAFLKAIRTSHASYRKLRRGQIIDMGDGVTARVLSPREASYQDPNDDSIVLRLTYKHVAILLSADATEKAESDMLASKMNLQAQVLEVGHHGSRDATSPEWLAAVKPRIAVISCAAHSRYGFPSTEVLRRLSSCEARTYVTGQCGAVTVTTDGSSIHVGTFRSP